MIRLRVIISGGQTGADRGALEAAHDLGLARGGMAPRRWRAEDGMIPMWYRTGMMTSASEAYPVRTQSNVEASGGTLIMSFGPLPHDSGSMLTANIARKLRKPLLAVNVFESGYHSEFLLNRVRIWIQTHRIEVLNVAGPRESREPGIQAAVRAALVAILCEEIGFGG